MARSGLKKSSRVVVGMIWLLLVFAVLFWSFVVLFKKSVRFNPGLGANLIVVGEKRVGIIVLRPGDEPSSFVEIPSNLLIKAWGLEGEYKVSSLWGLGKVEGVGGGSMIVSSLADALGFVPTGYVKVSDDDLVSPQGMVGEFFNPLLDTSLWWWDRWVIRRKVLEEINNFSLLEVDFPHLIYKKKVEADGVEVLQLASESVVDSWGRQIWLMEQVLEEGFEVELVNYSGEPGLARQMARKLANAGLGVIGLSSSADQSDDLKGCLLEGGDEESDVLSLYLIREVLGCRWEKSGRKVGLIRVGE